VCDYLASSRPTAVNLFWAIERMKKVAAGLPPAAAKQKLLDEALAMLEEDNRVCRQIGANGAALLATLRPAGQVIPLLTHCNAGGLATVQWGTALAPIYVGMERGLRFEVYADETRPLLQGSRITAFELQANGVPVTVICDNMAATVLSQRKVAAVIVGADRIAANGDTANKIGTHGLAILAKHFGVPFYVAAPVSTIDFQMASGANIPIEERDENEITQAFGKQTAPTGVRVFNPAFDVTAAKLIDAIVTERGVVNAPYGEAFTKLR